MAVMCHQVKMKRSWLARCDCRRGVNRKVKDGGRGIYESMSVRSFLILSVPQFSLITVEDSDLQGGRYHIVTAPEGFSSSMGILLNGIVSCSATYLSLQSRMDFLGGMG